MRILYKYVTTRHFQIVFFVCTHVDKNNFQFINISTRVILSGFQFFD